MKKYLFTTFLFGCSYYYSFGFGLGNGTTLSPVIPGTNTSVGFATQATNAAAGGNIVGMKLIPAFTHTYTGQSYAAGYGASGQTAGPAQTTYKLQIVCTAGTVGCWVLFGNQAANTLGANDIFVKAALQKSNGDQPIPIWFNGQRTVTIPPGGYAMGFCPVSFTNQEFGFVRTAVSAISGTWSKGQVHQLTGEGEGAGDLVDSGTISDSLGYSYCPLAIFGQVSSTRSCVAIFGDSIAMGKSSVSGPAADDLYDAGIVLGLGSNFGSIVPHALIGLDGDAFGKITTWSNLYQRLPIFQGCNVALVELGINDITGTYAALTNNAAYFWSTLRQMGITTIYQTTLTPKTTSSDSWATLSNQTTTAAESNRTNFNNLVRAGGFGLLSGYCDLEITAGTNFNGSIVWRTNYTGDGLHPYGTDTGAAIFSGLSTFTNKLYYQ